MLWLMKFYATGYVTAFIAVYANQCLKFHLHDVGVDSGDTIQVPKAGNQGERGVRPGNLYIKLKVRRNVPELFFVLV